MMLDRSPLEAAQQRAARAEALAADYAMAMDVLGRLSGVTTEHAVADIVLEFAQQVFGARRARMTVFSRRGAIKHVWERDDRGVLADNGTSPHQRDAADSEVAVWVGGLSVPILGGERPIGRIDVEELAYPDAMDAYADTVWIMAKVAGMAITNVRAMRGFVPICSACKAISDTEGTWHPVEQWLSEHSDVMLSHGLCPACFRQAQLDAGLEPDVPAPEPREPGPAPARPDPGPGVVARPASLVR